MIDILTTESISRISIVQVGKKLAELEASEEKLKEREEQDWDVEFEQEGRVRDDIFEVDEDEEYEDYEPNLEEE